MDLSEIFKIILIVLLIGCAIAVNLTPNLLQAVIIFMSYSSVMCLWQSRRPLSEPEFPVCSFCRR